MIRDASCDVIFDSRCSAESRLANRKRASAIKRLSNIPTRGWTRAEVRLKDRLLFGEQLTPLLFQAVL